MGNSPKRYATRKGILDFRKVPREIGVVKKREDTLGHGGIDLAWNVRKPVSRISVWENEGSNGCWPSAFEGSDRHGIDFGIEKADDYPFPRGSYGNTVAFATVSPRVGGILLERIEEGQKLGNERFLIQTVAHRNAKRFFRKEVGRKTPFFKYRIRRNEFASVRANKIEEPCVVGNEGRRRTFALGRFGGIKASDVRPKFSEMPCRRLVIEHVEDLLV